MASARPWKAMLTTAAEISVMDAECGNRPTAPAPRSSAPACDSSCPRKRASSKRRPPQFYLLGGWLLGRPPSRTTTTDRACLVPLRWEIDRLHFGGLSSFHGSFTLGIVSNSTLASLPSFISV